MTTQLFSDNNGQIFDENAYRTKRVLAIINASINSPNVRSAPDDVLRRRIAAILSPGKIHNLFYKILSS